MPDGTRHRVYLLPPQKDRIKDLAWACWHEKRLSFPEGCLDICTIEEEEFELIRLQRVKEEKQTRTLEQVNDMANIPKYGDKGCHDPAATCRKVAEFLDDIRVPQAFP